MLPYRTERHRIEGVVVTFTDATPAKAGYEAVRASETHLRLITNHLPAFIAHLGPDERYRYANPAYAQAFGKQPEDIPGLHVRDVVGDDIYQRHKPYRDAALNGEASISEHPLRPLRGELEWLLINWVPHYAPDGQGDGYFVLATDISVRKRAEEALRASEERLLALITDITQRQETQAAIQSALAYIEGRQGDGTQLAPEPPHDGREETGTA